MPFLCYRLAGTHGSYQGQAKVKFHSRTMAALRLDLRFWVWWPAGIDAWEAADGEILIVPSCFS